MMIHTRKSVPTFTKDLDIDSDLASLLAVHEPEVKDLANMSDVDLLMITGDLRRAANIREEIDRLGV